MPDEFSVWLTAEEDQANEATKAMARRLGTFRLHLFAQGFPEEQIHAFCSDYLNALLDSMSHPDPPEVSE